MSFRTVPRRAHPLGWEKTRHGTPFTVVSSVPYESRLTNSAVRATAARYSAGSGSPGPSLSCPTPRAWASSAARRSGANPISAPASRSNASGAAGGVLPARRSVARSIVKNPAALPTSAWASCFGSPRRAAYAWRSRTSLPISSCSSWQREHLRRQLEHELMGKLVRLRQAYAAPGISAREQPVRFAHVFVLDWKGVGRGLPLSLGEDERRRVTGAPPLPHRG